MSQYHVEHILCVRHLTHARGEGIQRRVLPALVTIFKSFFPLALQDCIFLCSYTEPVIMCMCLGLRPPNLASNSMTSSCVVSLLWVVLPVQSSSRNIWNGQVHLSFRTGLNISYLTPYYGSNRKRKWLESFWPSQLSIAFEAFCNSQSPGTSSVITCLSHFSYSLWTVVLSKQGCD